MGSNIRYKNSVFSVLFSEKDALRELYSALEGVTLPHDVPIELNTLSDVLYMGQINDISFTIGSRLVIVIEHQSTINPNMPLRLLLYIARIYEKIVERRNLYKSTLAKIPTPEFIVLYNGTKPYPDQTCQLSVISCRLSGDFGFQISDFRGIGRNMLLDIDSAFV